MRIPWPLFDLDRDTRAIVHAASEIAGAEGWPLMTPELLLHAALHDEAVATFWGLEAADTARSALRPLIERQQQDLGRQQRDLERGRQDRERRHPAEAAAGSAEADGSGAGGPDALAWSPLAQRVVITGFARAARRRYQRPLDVEGPPVAPRPPSPHWAVRALNAMAERARLVAGDRTWVGRGDLLHGLATHRSEAATLLAPLPRLFGGLDGEDPLVPPGDATGETAPPGVHLASVVIDDDAVSTMQAVVAVLRDVLDLVDARAAVSMHRVHFRGADRVVTLPWDDAQRAVLRCRAHAAEIAPSLGVRLVPA